MIEHECTEQENEMLALMEAGEWNDIQAMKLSTITNKEPEDIEQFKEDETNAYAHYQANAEVPEEERVANTQVKVEEENANA